jgi:putative endonuclease
MQNNKKQEGALGESFAITYLKERGYRILEHNFRTRNGEIDIVAIDTREDPPILAFIEVKTRTSVAYGSPLEAITYHKLRFLKRTAEYYAFTHPHLPRELRLDAVSVLLKEDYTVASIELVKNIS